MTEEPTGLHSSNYLEPLMKPTEAECKRMNLFEDETYDEFWNMTLLRNTQLTRSEAFELAMETYAENVYCNSLNHDLNRSVLWIVDYLIKNGMKEKDALKIGLILADKSLQELKAKTDDILMNCVPSQESFLEATIMEVAQLII